jgi:hypothetical protein
MDNFLPQSASILRAFARDTNQSAPSPAARKVLECIDSSFVILVKGHEYHQNLQDNGIKKEFVKQREHMDGGFESVDRRFDSVNKEFVKQREYMDGRFKSMDGRFKSMDGRFESVDRRFESVEAKLDKIEAMMFNSKAQRGWQQIHPVGVYHRDHGFMVHDDLPKTVKDFWKLNRRGQGQ